MDKRLNWLHLSDLHYGQKSQGVLWPKFKKELFKDIEHIKSEIGKIDIVFFTGDFVQSGKKEEYDELTSFLKELWRHFNKLSSNPYLVAIPGNHDLLRPDHTKAAVRVMKSYFKDREFQDDFWNGIGSKGEYYELISQCFENYIKWYDEVSLPKPDFKKGIMPGDISVNTYINDINLKIIGLNTAFLELGGDYYKGKLALNPVQLQALTSGDHVGWLENSDISLLLTHHDPSWYDSKSLDYYNNDINPPGLFFNHLCGHLHEPNAFQESKIGSKSKRIQLAPSLFGLQKINDKLDRINGYYAGSYLFNDTNTTEHFFPRKTIERYTGEYAIATDQGFEVNLKGFVELKFESELKDNNTAYKESKEAIDFEERIESTPNVLTSQHHIFDYGELDKLPKVRFPKNEPHLKIRLVEQEKLINTLKRSKFSWLITDWGLDENGFIGSVVDQLGLDNKSNFTLNCEDIVTDTDLVDAFLRQFEMSLQKFCNLVSRAGSSMLILNNINVNLYLSNNTFHRFFDVIRLINDYCPNLLIVLTARQVPKYITNQELVRLSPLDTVSVQTYLQNNTLFDFNLLDANSLIKIHDLTGGLPKHIDRVVDELKYMSLDEIIELDDESALEIIDTEAIPKSLKQTINILTDTNDKIKLRSFKLLKILTILVFGESLSNLSHFDPSEPIYGANASELEQLSLIEVVILNRVISQGSTSVTQQIKVLKVPRQIRDYVNTLITESERESIVKNACDLYFGSKWRNGDIRNVYGSSLSGLTKYLNIENCILIVKSLLLTAIKTERDFEVERASNLAINYCTHVYKADDYKNSSNAAEEIYNILKSSDLPRNKALITKLCGEAFRMTGQKDKALYYLNQALEIGSEYLSNDDRNDIYTELGYSYNMHGEKAQAIECAKSMQKLSKVGGLYNLQARYILAEATYQGEELQKKLKAIETESRRKNYLTLANNISYTLANNYADDNEKAKRLDKIINSKHDEYNKIRAIIIKSLDLLEYSDQTLTANDISLLNLSYSYLYYQRLESLFTSCHKALWLYCIKELRFLDLLNLFKHSSLVWRIIGEKEIEQEYFDELSNLIKDFDENFFTNKAYDLTNFEYFKRRQLEFSKFE